MDSVAEAVGEMTGRGGGRLVGAAMGGRVGRTGGSATLNTAEANVAVSGIGLGGGIVGHGLWWKSVMNDRV